LGRPELSSCYHPPMRIVSAPAIASWLKSGHILRWARAGARCAPATAKLLQAK
jgi:hypothetical protein